MKQKKFPVLIPEGSSIRVDRFIATLGLFSRSQIASRVNQVRSPAGKALKLSSHLVLGDTITLDWEDPPESTILPEAIDLDILYEDKQALIINKPTGMVVHPALGHQSGTLVQGLLHRYKNLQETFENDPIRPGIVHRLDKDSSGLLVAAKNPAAREALSLQFRQRSVRKTYLAITQKCPPFLNGELNTAIGRDKRNRKKFAVGGKNAKEALTHYHVLAEKEGYALLRVKILTGRSHQIRVHLSSLACPILGDRIYARKDNRFPEIPLLLHSWRLGLRLEAQGARLFEASLPARFITILKDLNIPIVLEDWRSAE